MRAMLLAMSAALDAGFATPAVFPTSKRRQTPAWIYTHVYCARGDSENRLKELKLALAFGRTSGT